MTRQESFSQAAVNGTLSAEQAPPSPLLTGAPLRAALARSERRAADRAEARARWRHTGWLLACCACGSGIVLIPAGCPALLGRLLSCLLFCACFLCFVFAWEALEDVTLIVRWREGKIGRGKGGQS